MKLVPGKCPECKENININSEKRAVICPNCNEPIVVEDAILAFNKVYGISNSNKAEDFTIIGGTLTKYIGMSMDVVIPSNVHRIGKQAFRDCTSIKSVTIPDTVTYIEEQAFANCLSLKEIIIPDNIEEIASFTFCECAGLETVVLPPRLRKIDLFAFHNCSSLKTIILPQTLHEIGCDSFSGCSSFEEIIIPSNVKYLGYGCFSGCSNLEKVKLPEHLKNDLFIHNFHNGGSDNNKFDGTPVGERYTKEKIRNDRIARNQCPECGSKLNFLKRCPKGCK